ncbi:MAG: hypothetical protein IJ106_07285 [Parasporobacterium sp.]|nr:hypothetical protein [Parasporobacterium sp.]
MNYLDQFTPLLEKGESVKWTGKPEPFEVIEGYNRKSLYLRWVLTVILGIAFLVWYILYATSHSDVPLSWLIIVGVLAIMAFIILRPFVDARTLRKKRLYAVTDKRLLIYQDYSTFYAANLEDIDEIRIVRKGNGLSDVIFGEPAVKKPYSQIRITAIVPVKGEGEKENTILGMAFYNIKNADDIRPYMMPGTKVTEDRIS